MKKLKNRRGETLSETLISMLIITLIFLFLSTAIIAAAKVNSTVDTSDNAFRTGTASGTCKVTIKSGGNTISTTDTVLYQTENGYCYYENTP